MTDNPKPVHQTTDMGPIPRDQWDHFQRLSEEHHWRQQEQIERLRDALEKIAKRWPCDNADTMSRLAKETLGDG